MGAFSDYLEVKILDHTLRNTAYTQPSGLWLALFTSTASLSQLEAGTLTNEVAAGGFTYARQTVAFTAGSSPTGASSNTAQLTWTNMPAVTVAYAAVCDALTAGNILYYGALTAPKTLNPGDTFIIAAADYAITLD